MDSTPPPPLSQTTSENYAEVVTPKALGKAGAIAIVVLGAQNYPLVFSLNDIPLATHYQGYIWVPVLPGTHKFHARQASFDFPAMQIPVRKGEITYLVIDNSWFGDTPYKVGTRDEFVQDLKDRPTQPVRVQLRNPVHAFLPAPLKNLLDTCGPQSIETSCKRALADIPPALISINRRAQITALIDAAKTPPAAAVAIVKTPPPSPKKSAPSESTRVAKTKDLSPTVLRYHFMMQIGDYFNADQPAKALPYFQKLNALPLPIDKTTNYYWAQALLASGDERGARSKLVRFLKNIDPSSDYYQPAVQLLTKIKG